MADFSGTVQVDADPASVFAQLSDVRTLPRYFSRMTSAEPGDGESVRTTARMPDGTEVQGEAWFRVDEAATTLQWGSEGPNDYRGELEVAAEGAGSTVTVRLRTTRADAGDGDVQDGIDETLAAVRRLVTGG